MLETNSALSEFVDRFLEVLGNIKAEGSTVEFFGLSNVADAKLAMTIRQTSNHDRRYPARPVLFLFVAEIKLRRVS
jgi:hypothetical protein